jgi:hypothetical protein
MKMRLAFMSPTQNSIASLPSYSTDDPRPVQNELQARRILPNAILKKPQFLVSI